MRVYSYQCLIVYDVITINTSHLVTRCLYVGASGECAQRGNPFPAYAFEPHDVVLVTLATAYMSSCSITVSYRRTGSDASVFDHRVVDPRIRDTRNIVGDWKRITCAIFQRGTSEVVVIAPLNL